MCWYEIYSLFVNLFQARVINNGKFVLRKLETITTNDNKINDYFVIVHWFPVVYYYLNNENCHDNDNSNETYLDNWFI